jgi:hypothetical protein
VFASCSSVEASYASVIATVAPLPSRREAVTPYAPRSCVAV